MSDRTTQYNDVVVKGFIISAIVWGAAAMLVGVIIAFQLVYPSLNFDLAYTSFGRLRPLHTNAAIFGFSLSIVFAAVYHSLQRLLRVRIFSDKLAMVHLVLYNLTIVGAAVTLLLGYSQSKEYAELEWPLDLMVAIWWVIFMINFFRHDRRAQRKANVCGDLVLYGFGHHDSDSVYRKQPVDSRRTLEILFSLRGRL